MPPIMEALRSVARQSVSTTYAVDVVNELCRLLAAAENSDVTGPAHEALITLSPALRARLHDRIEALRDDPTGATRRQPAATPLMRALMAAVNEKGPRG